MKLILRAAALAASALLLAGAASAAPPALDDPEATVVETLTVRAKLPGPAWWRVSDGDTTVYVLGLPDALPRGAKWDQSVLKRRLKGANVVITPPEFRASASPLAVPGAILDLKAATKSKTDLATVLPPRLKARFDAAAAAAGKKPSAYKGLKPWFAAIRLTEDFRHRVGLDFEQPYAAVIRLAKAAKVKRIPAMTTDMNFKTFIGQLKAVPEGLGLDCLEGAIEEVEFGASAVRNAGLAWTVGDTRGALMAPRGIERCWAILPGAAAAKRLHHRGEADAIARALARPGHAVAVLPIRSLVAKGGVLEQLKARGFTVTAPE